MAMSRYDPFREALSLRRAMDELFAQSFVQPGWMRGSQEMFTPMDVQQTDQGYQVRVAMPGVKPEDIEVTVQQNTLTIKGQYQSSTPQEESQERQGNWVVREIRSGSFERSVTFDRPIDADKIQTQYENGILTLTIPVSEASRPRRISIQGSQGQPQQVTVDAGQRPEQR
jgi:HSP20 family protein